MENTLKIDQPEPLSLPFIAIIGSLGFYLGVKLSIGFPIPAVAVVYAGLFFLFLKGIKYPEYIVLAFAVFIPFSKVMPVNISTCVNTLNLLDMLLVFGYFFHCYFTNKNLYQYNPLDLLLFIFWVIGLIQVIRSDLYFGGKGGIDLIIEYKRWSDAMLMYLIVFNVIHDRENIRRCLFVIIVMTVVVAAMTLKEFLDLGSVSSIEKMRIGGVTKQPNALGAFFAYYGHLILGVFIFFRAYKWRIWLLPIPILMIMKALQVTFSRGAWLSYAAGLMLIAAIKDRKLVLLGVVFLAYATIDPSVVPESIANRIQGSVKTDEYREASAEETLDKSAATRILIYKGGLKLISEYPFMGVGYELFPQYIPGYVPELEGAKRDPHNLYIKLAAEMGIPALLLFLTMVFMLFATAFWVYKNEQDKFIKACALGYMAGIMGLLVSCMFGSRLNTFELAGYFWLLGGLMMRTKYIIKSEQKQLPVKAFTTCNYSSK